MSKYEKPLSKLSYKEKQSRSKNKYAKFYNHFGNQFKYIQLQIEKKYLYAIAENEFGYWLLEIKNKSPKAYYIGFSKNTYINRTQKEKFIRDSKLFLDGSFIVTESTPRFNEAKAVKDFLTFEINLFDIKKDSDNDGYNDFFENLIFLNPNSNDTDSDGIPDFEDLNPLHKSENNMFVELYEIITEKVSSFKDFRNKYSFETFESDCEYFQKINPTNKRVLILSSNQTSKLKNNYRQGLFKIFYGRIKNDLNGKTFYVPYHEFSSGGKIIAIYEDEKWSITEQQEYIV